MILYFCDKKLNVYGCLSNQLPNSPIESDQLTKDIDSTVATLELTLDYTAQTRAELEQWTMPGRYILMRYDDGKDYVFQIIDAELDTGNMAIDITAEDAGLELLNVECLIYPDEEQGDTKDPQTLTWYVSKWIKGSGFEIGVNESSGTNKKALTFDSEQTATERLKEVASKFEMEIDYSFAIEGLTITHKYVNIHKKIGADNGVRLYAGRNLSSITVKRSIENLATCLLVYGSTPDGGLGPLTLDGYVYNDGNYYVDGHYVKSKTAVEKWGIITRTFEYDTTDQQTLLSEAIKELKTRADVEVNYEVDVADAPENLHVGDTVGIVDDAGGLYLSARILKMERSIIDHSTKLTIGNYLIKTAGLSATVQDMAKTFQIMKSSTKVVSDVQQMYCLSDSVDSSSGGTWTTQMPELMDDQHYLWTKTVVSYTDGYTSESAPVLAAAINGAANTATRYVTAQTESGQILVHPEGDTKNAVLIGQDVQIIRNGVTVATYSDAVKIGDTESQHIILDDDSFSINTSVANTVISIGSTHDSEGHAIACDMYSLGPSGSEPLTVMSTHKITKLVRAYALFWEDASMEEIPLSKLTVSGNSMITIDQSVFLCDLFVSYQTTDSVYGINFFENENTGEKCVSSGHNNKVSGTYSHAFGTDNVVSGYGAAAIGNGLIAHNQTVIGRYNEECTEPFVVGAGNADYEGQSQRKTILCGNADYISCFVDLYAHKNIYTTGRVTSGKESTEISLSNGASGTVNFYRKGDVVQITMAGIKLTGGANNRVIGTIPAGWRPARQMAMYDGTNNGYVLINSDGTITCRHTASTSYTVYAGMSYLAWG